MKLPLPCTDGVLLQTILRGTLQPGDDEQIAQHLQECEQCRLAFDILSETKTSERSDDEFADGPAL